MAFWAFQTPDEPFPDQLNDHFRNENHREDLGATKKLEQKKSGYQLFGATNTPSFFWVTKKMLKRVFGAFYWNTEVATVSAVRMIWVERSEGLAKGESAAIQT